MKETRRDFLIREGERGFIAGQTGSGKSKFALWMLERIPMSPVIIYDTKEEASFQTLTDVVNCTTQEEVTRAYNDQKVDYIVMRPPIDTVVDPTALDDLLYYHWLNYPNSVCYVDEAYQFTRPGPPGRGLTALFTRGRSRAITTLLATQRPAWISKFTISEAQRYYIFYLELADDKKNIRPSLLRLPDPPKYGFYYWKSGDKDTTIYGPVRLTKAQDTGYTDAEQAEFEQLNEASEGVSPVTPASKRRGAIFI